MACTCEGTSERYLMLTNGLLLLLSLVIIAYAIYELVDFGDLRAGFASFPIFAPLGVGIVLLLVSALGVIGARTERKVILITYLIIVFIVTVFVLASGAALLSYGGYLSDVQDGNVDQTIQQNIVDFELAVFNKCCADAGEAQAAVPCSSPAVEPCIHDSDRFDTYSGNINDDVCDALTHVKINDVAVVGPNATGSCGGGDPSAFVDSITDYLKDNIVTLGSVNLGIAVVMLLILIATCVLIFTGHQARQRRKEQEAKQGGPITA